MRWSHRRHLKAKRTCEAKVGDVGYVCVSSNLQGSWDVVVIGRISMWLVTIWFARQGIW